RPSGGTWAVMIGINDYPGTSHDLRAAVADAADMNVALAQFGVPADHRLLLQDGQATADVVRQSADWLVAHAGPDAVAVFFYAGHVRKLARTTEAIVGADGNLVTDADLASRLARLQARRAWIVMASCFGGGFTEALAPGRILTAAAGADDLAYENASFDRSYLVEYMIRQAMIEGRASGTVEDAFNYARAAIAREHPGREPVEIDDGAAPLDLRPPGAKPASTAPARSAPASGSTGSGQAPPPSPPPSPPTSGPRPPASTTTTTQANPCGNVTHGIVKHTRDPMPPGPSSTQMRPPWWAAIRSHTARPTPVPGLSTASGSRRNRRNTSCRRAGAMPTPLSATVTRQASASGSRSAVMVTMGRRSSGTKVSALASSCSSRWPTCSGSTVTMGSRPTSTVALVVRTRSSWRAKAPATNRRRSTRATGPPSCSTSV